MSVYYSDESVTLYHGDCREITEWLAADVLVTDPPYGRAWKQGDVNTRRGWASSTRGGIAGDDSTVLRDEALQLWGTARPAVAFGDLMLPPPRGTKHILIYDKGDAVGFHGAIAGHRRNVEAVYLIGAHQSGLGGASAIIRTSVGHPGHTLAKMTGHPHTKPLDVMCHLVSLAPGVVADPFAGSGTTLAAAKHLGRQAIGVEVDEAYCEVIAKRLSQGAFDFAAP